MKGSSSTVRVIARLDVKNDAVIKGYQMEGFRKVGQAGEMARRYYGAGVDEIFYIDVVASHFSRDSLEQVLASNSREIFVPITAVGGIRTVRDAARLFRAGADKVGVNSAALTRPALITEIAETYGTQATVLSVEAKRVGDGDWRAFYDSGRENSGRDVSSWVQEAIAHGAGEILLTSVDRDGTRKGFDRDLVSLVAPAVDVPLVVSGGGTLTSALDMAVNGTVDGFAFASLFHEDTAHVDDVKRALGSRGVPVRVEGT